MCCGFFNAANVPSVNADGVNRVQESSQPSSSQPSSSLNGQTEPNGFDASYCLRSTCLRLTNREFSETSSFRGALNFGENLRESGNRKETRVPAFLLSTRSFACFDRMAYGDCVSVLSGLSAESLVSQSAPRPIQPNLSNSPG